MCYDLNFDWNSPLFYLKHLYHDNVDEKFLDIFKDKINGIFIPSLNKVFSCTEVEFLENLTVDY